MSVMCSPTCLYAIRCSTTSCVCRLGFHGTDCSMPWSSVNYSSWQGVRYMWAALNGVVLILATFFFLLHLWKTRKVTKGAIGELFIMASALMGMLTFAIDPLRFVAVTEGFYTPGYRAGMSVLSNLYIGFISCAYSVLVAQWLSIRAPDMLAPDEWTTRATVFAVTMSTIVILTAFVCAGLLAVSDSADTALYVIFGAITVFQCVVQMGSCILTLRDLSRLETVKNHTALKRVTIHSLIWGSLVLVAVATLVMAIASSTFNSTFELFLGVQFSLPALTAIIVRVAFSFHFRYRSPVVQEDEDFRTVKQENSKKRTSSQFKTDSTDSTSSLLVPLLSTNDT